jgi:ribonuclease I
MALPHTATLLEPKRARHTPSNSRTSSQTQRIGSCPQFSTSARNSKDDRSPIHDTDKRQEYVLSSSRARTVCPYTSNMSSSYCTSHRSACHHSRDIPYTGIYQSSQHAFRLLLLHGIWPSRHYEYHCPMRKLAYARSGLCTRCRINL